MNSDDLINLAHFLAAIIAAVGSGLSGIVAAVGGIKVVAGLLLNLVMTAISYLMRPKQPKPDEIMTVFRQAIQPRQKHYGYLEVGGAVVALQVYKKVVYQVTYHSEGTADIEGFRVDKRPVQIKADNGELISEPYFDPNGGAVRLRYRTGSVPGIPYPELSEGMPTIYGPSHRFDGMVTSLVRGRSVGQKYNYLIYPNVWPVVTCIARYNTCYDPRTRRRAYTQNRVLHAREYLTDPDGAGIAAELIDDADTFIRMANRADEVLPTKAGGSVRRWEGSFSYKLIEPVRDMVQRLMFEMDGRLYLKPDGKIGIHVGGVWEEPTVHITDDHIVEHSIKTSAPPPQESTEVVLRWTDPLSTFGERTTQPWYNTKLLKLTKGARRNQTFEAFGIQHHNNGRRLAKILSYKLNPEFQGVIKTTLFGLKAIDQRYIYVDLDAYGVEKVPMEVLSWSLDGDLMVKMKVSSVDPAMYAFDPLTEEGDAPVIQEVAPPDELVEVSDFRVSVRRTSAGVTLAMVVKTPPRVDREGDEKEERETQNEQILTEFQWAVAGSNDWQPMAGPSEQPRGQATGITLGGPFDARARHLGTTGIPSTWVIIEDIDDTATSKAPAPPTAVTASVLSATSAQIVLSTPADDQFAAIRVYRGATSDPAAATAVDTRYLAAGKSATIVVENQDPGTAYFFVSAFPWAGPDKESARVPAANNPITL